MFQIKQAMKNGEALIGIMIEEMTTPNIAKILAACGFKYFIIDCEHGSFNDESVASIISVAKGSGIIPMVRVPEIRKDTISKPLEAGAMGLLIPQIKTVEDVKRVVEEARYAPQGKRGISHTKPHNNYITKSDPEQTKKENDEVMIILQIETKEAIENLDEILSVEGIDAALIGPNDLSQSYGILGQFDNPIILQAFDKVIEVSKKHDIISGVHFGDIKNIEKMGPKGMRLLMWNTEVGLIIDNGIKGVNDLTSLLKSDGINCI
ncbi:hypothetical protein D2962_02630 [Biomaibacter acetigenes]|uniref:HpcH/HpaI aldolase/citrate lyase domain-containing protein n=1 Tax=Biomaibacter acetigenes TaxID=2316383 RepID=A0A3G2R3Y5_9FIRM|nr:aldolase/citrate lyase family protein [Biomaibacter acetigenes]AYO29647.1 hypothetical protein D2962_02630 [Biomaibacter acetigenes]